MRASRGMGDLRPSKMPKAKIKPRRDNTDFESYERGGKIKMKSTKSKRKGDEYGY